MTTSIGRRTLLQTLLGGAGALGLRSLATGLPVAFLANPRRALAAAACTPPTTGPFFILNTSSSGDPINANAPGCYTDPGIIHSDDPRMAATAVRLGGINSIAAKPWAQLPQSVLDRMSFWHLSSNTNDHSKLPNVLQLMGATRPIEMLPSLLAKTLAPCLQTTQSQPISLGARTPTEALKYNGAPLPTIPPLALKATLLAPAGELGKLSALRDQTLGSLTEILKNRSTAAQKKALDNMVMSQREVRNLNQNLLDRLSTITDNTSRSQIKAALVLIQMKVSPVVAIQISFGGDNHFDTNFVRETTDTIDGVATIGALMAEIDAAGLQDQINFVSLGVFGRSLKRQGRDGRDHNANHQVSWAIGKAFKPGIYGSVVPFASDYGATAIRSATGLGDASGDIAVSDTLASFGKTMLKAAGADSETIESSILRGTVISGALA